jgi:hypothetical protein
VEAAVDLADIEIYLLGLKSLHRQRRSNPQPEAKPFSVSRDNYTRTLSRVPLSEEASELNSLRCCDGWPSSAYIGITAILAVFILTFATAPKARAQDNGHHFAAHRHIVIPTYAPPPREAYLLHGIRLSKLTLFPRRS